MNLPSLLHNPAENPFSEVIQSFLERQLTLDGNAIIISEFGDISSFGLAHIFEDQQGKPISYQEVFDHNNFNVVQDIEQLKSYLKLNLVAQSVENFESYLNKMVIESMKINCKNDLILRIASKSLRENKEKIKFLKSYSPKLNSFILSNEGKAQYDLFLFLESIRHIIVHQDQKIKPSDRIRYDSEPFTRYFKIKNDRITIDGRIIKILEALSNFSYQIFFHLSREFSFAIRKG